MLTTIEKKSLLKIVAAGSCSAIITLASFIGSLSAETLTITFQPASDTTINNTGTGSGTSTTTLTPLPPGNCLFSAQLAADPALKAAYIAEISAIKDGTVETDDALIYQTDINVAGSPINFREPEKSVDRLSHNCLSCHDGVTAQNFKVRIKNNPSGRVMSLEDIIGGHPVGMEYGKYVSVDAKGYRGDVSFSQEMVFAEGKVGCLTCHNPLNKDKGHLVMRNDRSELCFACHNK